MYRTLPLTCFKHHAFFIITRLNYTKLLCKSNSYAHRLPQVKPENSCHFPPSPHYSKSRCNYLIHKWVSTRSFERRNPLAVPKCTVHSLISYEINLRALKYMQLLIQQTACQHKTKEDPIKAQRPHQYRVRFCHVSAVHGYRVTLLMYTLGAWSKFLCGHSELDPFHHECMILETY